MKRIPRRYLSKVLRRAAFPILYVVVVGVGLAVFVFSIRSCRNDDTADTGPKSTSGVNITFERR